MPLAALVGATLESVAGNPDSVANAIEGRHADPLSSSVTTTLVPSPARSEWPAPSPGVPGPVAPTPPTGPPADPVIPPEEPDDRADPQAQDTRSCVRPTNPPRSDGTPSATPRTATLSVSVLPGGQDDHRGDGDHEHRNPQAGRTVKCR